MRIAAVVFAAALFGATAAQACTYGKTAQSTEMQTAQGPVTVTQTPKPVDTN
ncbi:MAG: hypothetical protein ACPGOY_16245 [Rhodospirillaceae bacterium]